MSFDKDLKSSRRLTAVLFICCVVALFVTAALVWYVNIQSMESDDSQSTASVSTEEISSEEPPPVKVEVDLVAVGDNLIHMQLIQGGRKENGRYNFESYYEGIKKEVEEADIAVVNQETILGGASLGYSGYPLFNSPQEFGQALVNTGFDVVLHATNHTMDKGFTGVENTLAFWAEYPDVAVLGIHGSAEEQEQITIKEVDGIKMALLNYTFSLNGLSVPASKPYLVDEFDKERMEADIKKAKEEADLVIVFPHWGTEYIHEADDLQKEYTDFFASLNVDLVIGGHPHVIQPIEWVERADGKQMPVYYSLGNMISRQDRTPRLLGGMARVTIEKERDQVAVTKAKVTPIVCHYEYNDKWHFAVYKLEDYTEELASVHNVRTVDATFSLDMLNQLSLEVFGDNIE